MELLPLGPVVLIDTPGLDDYGPLGDLRVQKTYQMLNKTDIAILVVDGTIGMTKEDLALLEQIQKNRFPMSSHSINVIFARLTNPRCQIRLQTPRKTDQLFLSVLLRISDFCTQRPARRNPAKRRNKTSDRQRSALPHGSCYSRDSDRCLCTKGTSDPSTAADHPGYFGSSWACALRTGYGASPDIRRTVCQTTNGHHRQSGFCSGRPTDAKRYPPYFFFNSCLQGIKGIFPLS